MSGIRVAALIPTDRLSGPARQLMTVATRLRSMGVDFRIVMFRRPGQVPGALPSNLDRRGVKNVVVSDARPLDFGLAERVRDVLGEWDSQIVQTHGYKATAVAWLLRRRSAPDWHWIAFFHGHTSESRRARLYHRLDRRMMRSADRIVVMSELQRAEFARHTRNVQIFHNAMTDAMETAPSGSEVVPPWASAARPLIGVIGRLSREKGVGVFLRAVKRLAEEGLPFTALIAGDGPLRHELERYCADHGIADRVRFLGHVDAIGHLYRALDLLVIPSLSEGLPNVLLEALRAGLPVVATRVGAIPEVFFAPAAGTLVPPDSADALTDAIHAALTGGPDPKAETDREKIVAAFAPERRAEHHLALYHELLERTTVPGVTEIGWH